MGKTARHEPAQPAISRGMPIVIVAASETELLPRMMPEGIWPGSTVAAGEWRPRPPGHAERREHIVAGLLDRRTETLASGKRTRPRLKSLFEEEEVQFFADDYPTGEGR